MFSRQSFAGWYRNRFVWVTAILALTAGAVVLTNSLGSEAEPADLRAGITARMRSTLEQVDPEQHHHAHHAGTEDGAKPAVVCGVRVYGHEPAEATTLADVRTVYGFHLCGIAEQKRPWDWAVKLVGPVIMDMTTEPAGIRVVEATADVAFVDRLREMFPQEYVEQAREEALAGPEMADLRRRYDAAAGL